MQFETRTTIKKLNMELELISAEDPFSIIPLLIGINSVQCPEHNVEGCYRNINFMSYEIKSLCNGLNENQRFEQLNHYFFKTKSFMILPLKPEECSEEDLLIRLILSNRAGAPLPVALIYLHLASHLELPAYLIKFPFVYILKWIRGGKSNFIDLSDEGKILSETQLLFMANNAFTNSKPELSNNLEILPTRNIILKYLSELLVTYENSSSSRSCITILNLCLKLAPSNLKYLGKRALLLRSLGFPKEAMSDLKRYFSFIDKAQSPPELRMAYYEIFAILNSSDPKNDYLH